MRRPITPIEHPSDIPLLLEQSTPPPHLRYVIARNGCLSCFDAHKHEPGSLLRISLPDLNDDYWAWVRVHWCCKQADNFQLGLDFLDREQAFRFRLGEQIAQINLYRQQIHSEEGRWLNQEQAAKEWIGKFAAAFPAHPV